LKKVTAGEASYFYHEYPCHSPSEQRWFSLRLTRFECDGEAFVVVAHDNITARKTAELKVQETNQALRKLTLTDSLTGVGNRRAFDGRIGQEWHRHLRSQRNLTVAMIDIDCFKLFNDLYGHQAGDETIRQVGTKIAKSLRLPTDFVCRYGGEEFAVIMPYTSISQAKSAMHRVLAAITALKIGHSSSLVAPYVTVSIGIANAIPSSETTPDQLVKRADEALYLAKVRGRNRVAVSKPAVPAQSHAIQFGQVPASEIR
jgi:diguanylate cyclase (GGDEF)-like protein